MSFSRRSYLRSLSFKERSELRNDRSTWGEDIVCLKKRFYLDNKKIVGKGKQGIVFSAIDAHTNENVAVKLISKDNYNRKRYQSEIKILKALTNLPDMIGFPGLIAVGQRKNHYIVTELLGDSLLEIQTKFCSQSRLRMKHVLMIGIQLLHRIQTLHSLGYVHGDIKPANLMFGLGSQKRNILYLIDYGLSKTESRYRKPNLPSSIFKPSKLHLMGTPLYASINQHLGWNKAFKKDDIESFTYFLINLAKGVLPWYNIKIKDDDNYNEILQAKLNATAQTLWEGLPASFKSIYNYVRRLEHYDKIDYGKIEGLLYTAASEEGINNFPTDWDSHKFHWILEGKRTTEGVNFQVNKVHLQSVDHLKESSFWEDEPKFSKNRGRTRVISKYSKKMSQEKPIAVNTPMSLSKHFKNVRIST